MFFFLYFYVHIFIFIFIFLFACERLEKKSSRKSFENLSIFEFRNDYEIAYLNRVFCLSRCGAPVIIREFMKLTQDYAGLMAWFSLLINVNAKATGVVNINKRARERIPPLYSPKLVIKFAETRFNLYIHFRNVIPDICNYHPFP